MTSWELAVEETQQHLLVFRSRWAPRLLQHSLLLWRSLVLLLKQQREEAAHAQAWRNRRLATHALQFWAGYAAARAAQRGAVAAAVRLYEQKLLRRKLLQWSLVACATSAARAYHQHGMLQRLFAAWRGLIAANRVDALRLELQQQGGGLAGAQEGGNHPQAQHIHWQHHPTQQQQQQSQASRLQALMPLELLPLQQQQQQQQPGLQEPRGCGPPNNITAADRTELLKLPQWGKPGAGAGTRHTPVEQLGAAASSAASSARRSPAAARGVATTAASGQQGAAPRSPARPRGSPARLTPAVVQRTVRS
jgi:hypothetical protein